MKKNIIILSLCMYGVTHAAAALRVPLIILPKTVLIGTQSHLMRRIVQRSHSTHLQRVRVSSGCAGCSCKHLNEPCFLVTLEESRKNMQASLQKAQVTLRSPKITRDQRLDLFHTVECFPRYIVNTNNLIDAYQKKCLERNNEQE